jgi:hypothetical protein
LPQDLENRVRPPHVQSLGAVDNLKGDEVVDLSLLETPKIAEHKDKTEEKKDDKGKEEKQSEGKRTSAASSTTPSTPTSPSSPSSSLSLGSSTPTTRKRDIPSSPITTHKKSKTTTQSARGGGGGGGGNGEDDDPDDDDEAKTGGKRRGNKKPSPLEAVTQLMQESFDIAKVMNSEERRPGFGRG